MQSPYNDRWERTKWYLFRNLLENPGFRLSPVPEESRSESSDDRPYSPLPDLIIEREPNRHDETEEFYQELEVRMKRYYKRLFVDGEEEVESEGVIDSSSEISEFEVNKSMASTFIINDHELSEADEIRTIENRFDSGKITKGRGDRFDEMKLSSNSSDAESEYSSKDERTEFITDLDKADDMQVQSNESKTVDTESDSPQDCHKISITKVEIHEEVKRTKPMTRVFEDGSPVLIPRCHKFSRIVFGYVSREIMNAMQSEDNIVVENVDDEKFEEIEGSVKIIETHSFQKEKEGMHLEISSEESDLEVQWLMYKPKASSTTMCKTLESKVTDASGQIISKDIDQEEIADNHNEMDDDNHEEVVEAEKIQKGDDEHFKTLKSIGSCDSYLASDTDDNSIEMAITRAIFERKNRMNISDFQTDKFESSSEEFEDIEVMRGTIQTRLRESFQGESTESQESPIVGTFATRTTATEIEEIDDHIGDQTNASVKEVEDMSTEFHQSCQKESTTTQDSSAISTLVTQEPSVNLGFIDYFFEEENESHDEANKTESNEIAQNIPTLKHTKSVEDVCNDIWSVSPIPVDFEELSPNTPHMPISVSGTFNKNKRESDEIIEETAPKSKKKKYKNAEIQTSATKTPRNSWNDIKTSLFVGSPLIFKLCGCKDHVCS